MTDFLVSCPSCDCRFPVDSETMRASSVRESTAPTIGVLHGGNVDERASGGGEGLQPRPFPRLSTEYRLAFRQVVASIQRRGSSQVVHLGPAPDPEDAT